MKKENNPVTTTATTGCASTNASRRDVPGGLVAVVGFGISGRLCPDRA